jgi:hypothetical protein
VAKYSKDQRINENGCVKDEEEIDAFALYFEKALTMIKTGEMKDPKTIRLLQYARINE